MTPTEEVDARRRKRFRSLLAASSRAGSWFLGLLLLALGVTLGAWLFGDTPSTTLSGQEAAPSAAAGEWTCSMHPQIRRPGPGQCPICGMDLVPVTPTSADSEHPERITLSDRARALAKVQTTTVQRRADGALALHLLGRIEANETTLRTVTAWTGGRIDRLIVKATGMRIRAGQAIATLYSPEIFAAHQDLIVAQRQVERLSSAVESAQYAARQAQLAARERLRLLGVGDEEIASMEAADRPTRSVPIRSPFSGTVIERMATEGAYVTTGTPLYKVADLSRLWVQLDAYESDLGRVRVGQSVSVTVDAFPGESFVGEVTFIDPTLDPQRRTSRVRVEVKNPDGRLRPGMFAQAVVQAGIPSEANAPLVIPQTSALFTGRRSIVYVEQQYDDRYVYEPRTVRLGPRLQDAYPVVAGLAEGERVVTRGTFAIDSDAQIRGKTSMMTSADDTDDVHDALVPLSKAELSTFEPLVQSYLAVQQHLADDDLQAAKREGSKLEQAAAAVSFSAPLPEQAWGKLETAIRPSARLIMQAETIEAARSAFERLSDALMQLLRRFGNPLSEPLHVAHCPMAFGSRGAAWVQQGKEIDNAYFGAAMRTCGEVTRSVEPGSHLAPEAKERPKAAPRGHQH